VSAITTPDHVENCNEQNMDQDFDSAFKKYYPVILKHAAYLTGSIQAAEDLAQEAFAKLYKTPPTHSNTIAWLSKVTSNLAYNYLRDEKGRKSKDVVYAEDDVEKVISIDDRVIRNQEIRLTKKVLSSLPVRDRICLLLKFSGYKYDEIAEIIEVEKTSVGTILARAQAKFRERYLEV
jgi:RNA polymerase sigma factor (sigma-70 family)